MLEVQKEALANRTRQRLVALREKELELAATRGEVQEWIKAAQRNRLAQANG